MPVCRFVKPFHLLKTGCVVWEYGVGEYNMPNSDAYNSYVLSYTEFGRCENDDVKVTNPGPPVIIHPR